LRTAEEQSVSRDEERRKLGEPEEDLPEADPMHQRHEWFSRLRPELSSWAASRVDNLRQLPVRDRKGQIPDLLWQQVLHIEKKWGLPESPV
jgi:hypothetical protein